MSNLPQNFVDKTIPASCTVWIGATNNKGYGLVVADGREVLAHRVAYEAERGPIPDGYVIDHLCRVRNCVTVSHLEVVTVAENNRRGRRAASLSVGDTCNNGHLLGPDDLYERPSGRTECHPCRRDGAARDGSGHRRRTTSQRTARVVRQQITSAVA